MANQGNDGAPPEGASAATKRIEMLTRLAMPNFLRQLYRVSRSAFAAPTLSPELPDALVEGARMFGSRLSMLNHLPKEGVVVELGTLRGDFAAAILEIARPRALHLVDVSFARLREDVAKNPAVTLRQSTTLEALASFADQSADWIYIDAGHDYGSAAADAAASANKVKPGGYLVFNDFAHIDPYLGRYGVHRAACEFCLAHGWPMAFFAMQGAALYDVAFRRPA